MTNEHILEVKNLQKAYGRHEVLRDISFSVGRGEIIGLLGKNGSGKTTLMKSMLGLLNHGGEVLFDGNPLDPNDAKTMKRIGVLVDTVFFEEMTAYDNLKILMLQTPFRDNTHLGRDIMELLRFVGLEDNAKDRVKGFSFGMKQRLALAQSLTDEPDLLILDEPFVGLDPPGITLVKEKLIALCKVKKTSIIFSSHQLDEVEEMSEELVVIESGRVGFFGAYEELKKRNMEYRIIADQPFSISLLKKLDMLSCEIKNAEDGELVLSHGEKTLDLAIRCLHDEGLSICEIIREDKPLESLFV